MCQSEVSQAPKQTVGESRRSSRLYPRQPRHYDIVWRACTPTVRRPHQISWQLPPKTEAVLASRQTVWTVSIGRVMQSDGFLRHRNIHMSSHNLGGQFRRAAYPAQSAHPRARLSPRLRVWLLPACSLSGPRRHRLGCRLPSTLFVSSTQMPATYRASVTAPKWAS
ncbi:unnamed protein product [Protopolystoma xenopodis]|uniref:Uncharacterized protein n=1 Tax=Protopolystoma xenopodis TaxID=117903 RepID=A0A3S5CQG0_9PLAT|nr:unnamed protein product [Protopolystoma xenopodis]